MDDVELYHIISKHVAKAVAKAAAKDDRNYYSTFARTMGKYEGYRYAVGALLAQHNIEFTIPPLEVGIGQVAATKFHREHQRWPECPFDVDRFQSVITEIR